MLYKLEYEFDLFNEEIEEDDLERLELHLDEDGCIVDEYGCSVDTEEYNNVIYSLEENLEDIISYEFERKYNKPYNPLTYYLEPGAKEFIKSLETEYYSNHLDIFGLYHTFEFKDWLKDKYEPIAHEKALLNFYNW